MLEETKEQKQELVNEYEYTNEELENISNLCSVLQKIRARLISEGYSIEELREKFSHNNLKVV